MINRYEILRRLGRLSFLQRKKQVNQNPSAGTDQNADPSNSVNHTQEFEIDSGFSLYDFEAAEKGSKPNYAKLRAETTAAQARTSAGLRPAPFDIDRANENYRNEREAFVQARAAGKASINSIDDWGLRMRMIACDRAAARTRAAQSRQHGMRPG